GGVVVSLRPRARKNCWLGRNGAARVGAEGELSRWWGKGRRWQRHVAIELKELVKHRLRGEGRTRAHQPHTPRQPPPRLVLSPKPTPINWLASPLHSDGR